jgi:hypothetical protein
MSEMTTTLAPRRRTATYLGVEAALKAQHPDQPNLDLESWVRAQRKLAVAWRPMADRLWKDARLDLQPSSLQVGYEALRRWFGYLEEEPEAVAARTE